jgi:crotonobetainyl-CoA:carnitine CoA-transferase CaiB-like acyl-CoA transferase
MARNLEMLEGMRVLDLTNDTGYLCGRILADLGADVVKVERPCGDPGRRLGPFYHDDPDPEKSLYWFAYNMNKKGITLDIETSDGRELFKKLVAKADIVVESFAPGRMAQLELDHDVLSAVNPRIILTSISPFGQAGPYHTFKGSDLVLMGMAGFMSTCGDPDRAPLRISFPQSSLFAGAQAAAGTMIAYYSQLNTGVGQRVDISAQESISWTSGGFAFFYLLGILLTRAGQYRVGLSTSARQRLLWPCKDGWVTFQIYGGKFGAKSNRALVDWMNSEGYSSDFQKNVEWETFDMAQVTQEIMTKIEEPIAAFFMAHTKAELEAGAIQRDIMFYAASDMEDVYNSPQFRARDYWVEVQHPELNTAITYPGDWAKFSGFKMKHTRAPLIGEHNSEIYKGELGLSDDDLALFKQAGVV